MTTDIYKSKILHKQILSIYQQSFLLFFATIFISVLMVNFFWGWADKTQLISWFLVNVALTILRMLLVFLFYQKKPDEKSISKWGVMFAITSGLSGFVWGATAFVLMDPARMETVLVVMIILTGTTSGAMLALSVYIWAWLAYAITVLTTLLVALLMYDSAVFDIMAFAVFVFLLFNFVYAWLMNSKAAESFRVHFENQDLIENLYAQMELVEKANTDKSRFLVATSHDLRQPLHAMDLFLGALGSVLTTAEQKQLLQKTRNSSRSLSELLNALMDVSKLDSGTVNVELKKVSLLSLLTGLYEEYNALAIEKGRHLRRHFRNLYVLTDPVLLARMVRNLLSNAIKHNDAGDILLGVRRRGQTAVIEVTDTGKGFSELEQEDIFSEFFQLNNPERDRSKGLGLGLAIVRRLSRLLNHPVTVKSTPERGSCFRITAPLTDSPSMVNVLDAAGSQKYNLSGYFVVVIDDESLVRDAMRTLLRSWLCEVLICDSEEMVVAELQQHDYQRPDIIIADYRLREGKTGLQAVAGVRDLYDDSISAIIITGDTNNDVRLQATEADCKIMFKPVEAKTLYRTLCELLF